MSPDAGHFTLFGYPLRQEDLEQPLRLKEATVVADAPQLRRLADFFAYAAEQMENGAVLDGRHFCDFARVPQTLQRLADVIVASPR